jgi:hypothetical protein
LKRNFCKRAEAPFCVRDEGDFKNYLFESFTDYAFSTLKTTNSFVNLEFNSRLLRILPSAILFFLTYNCSAIIYRASFFGKALKAHYVIAPNEIWGSNERLESRALKARSVPGKAMKNISI